MGRPDKITPDIVEWLLSDEKVVSKWKEIANRVNLSAYVPRIDQNYSYKKKKFEKQKLKELLEVWRVASPITYSKSRLMDILNKEGLTEMYSWLEIMSTENSPRKNEISQLLKERQNCIRNSSSSPFYPKESSFLLTPRSAVSLSPQPFTNTSTSNKNDCEEENEIYSTHLKSRSLTNSPYSWYFEESKMKTYSEYNGILKNKDTSTATNSSSRESSPNNELLSSRPTSRFSNDGSCASSATRKKSIRFADELSDYDYQSSSKSDYGFPNHFEQLQKCQTGNTKKKTSSSDVLDSSSTKKNELFPKKANHNFSSNPQVHSVEKYFDNLISMIENAADGL